MKKCNEDVAEISLKDESLPSNETQFQSIFAINLSKNNSHKNTLKFDLNSIWNTVDEVHDNNTDAYEIWRLRKECQRLVEENRRLQGICPKNIETTQLIVDSTESSILQNQVENLQWQLKQMEFNRKMCNNVILEVIRYLEKCHSSLNVWHQHLKECNIFNNNEILLKERSMKFQQTESEFNSSSPNSTFKDFTWGKTVKSSNISKTSPQENDPKSNHLLTDYFNSIATGIVFEDGTQLSIERLSKESFRLLRTIENFLSTQNQTISKPLKLPSNNSSINSSFSKDSDLEFLYDLKTDATKKQRKKKSTSVARQHTENDYNESGFSSMNSFHEIGLPVNLEEKAKKSYLSSSFENFHDSTKINVLWV